MDKKQREVRRQQEDIQKSIATPFSCMETVMWEHSPTAPQAAVSTRGRPNLPLLRTRRPVHTRAATAAMGAAIRRKRSA